MTTPNVQQAPNPNLFAFQVNGQVQYADPLKVRRDLLSATMGKCWGIIKRVSKVQGQISEARKNAETIQKDLEANPTTEEEMKVLAECQKAHAEGKLNNLSFEQLPRVMKADQYDNQVALFCNEVAQLEGVLSEAAYTAFDLPKIDFNTGVGVTEQEAIELLKSFVEYAEGKGERLGS